MENEWKLRENEALAKLKQEEVETKARLDQEKIKLQQLRAESEVKIAAEHVRALSLLNDLESYDVASCHNFENTLNDPVREPQSSLNPLAASFKHHHTSAEREELSLAEALANSLVGPLVC
ncbi:hypothetical protein AMECASPLE_039481 [Ameca splendens]|uniref:Uncharacterized protein n=1 Tax=Ameca splendens TaxID=208324 RepID=A0ABV0Z6P5_9TELE